MADPHLVILVILTPVCYTYHICNENFKVVSNQFRADNYVNSPNGLWKPLSVNHINVCGLVKLV